MKSIFILIVLSLSLSTYAFAQSENQEYESTLKKMMEVTGSEASFNTVVNQMITMFKNQQGNDVPEKFWDELAKEMNSSALDELTSKLVPVYQEHLSIEDLQGIIAFYNTPLGKKYAEKTPAITASSMEIGQTWGAELGMKIAKRLKDEGY